MLGKPSSGACGSYAELQRGAAIRSTKSQWSVKNRLKDSVACPR